MRAFLPVLLFLGACEAFWQGLEEGRTPGPAATVDPAALSEAPSTAAVRAWLAHHQVVVVDGESLTAEWGAVSRVAPEDLARAWVRLDQSTERMDEVLAVVVFTSAGAYPPPERRTFLEGTELRTGSRLSLPLYGLTGWVDTLTSVSPERAMNAHLEVLEPDEVASFVRRNGIVDDEHGDWEVREERLAALPASVRRTLVERLDAGSFGPRSEVVRAVERLEE